MKRRHKISYRNDKKWLWLLTAFLILFALLLGACEEMEAGSAAVPGSNVWIEFPVENTILPMEPVKLVVYATNAGSVGAIQLKINGEALQTTAPSPMTVDGSLRLARLDQLWEPPAAGEYIVEASFGDGTSKVRRFCIVTCDRGEQPAAKVVQTGTPTSHSTTTPGTITPTMTATAQTKTPEANLSVTFYAQPYTVQAGSCATVFWEVEGSETVYLNNNPVQPSGSKETCPCKAENYNLRVGHPDGTFEDQYLTVNVNGSCYVPPPASPTPTRTQVPSDTNGPSYNSGYLIWESCQFFGASDISDPSGVSWAKFGYNLNNQGWMWLWMSDTGYGWQSEYGVSVMDGIGTPIGSVQYQFQAMDDANNQSTSGIYTYDYTGCDG